uniref:Uncharacterized protein n=1 Tax=Panagrolaimus davidi TaxID=227884 RepID=A0A914PDY7_9BILA
MSDMLKVIGVLGESTPDDYCIMLLLFHVQRKRQTSQPEPRPADTKAADAAANRGIGYERGSTKSQWDIERTVEERIERKDEKNNSDVFF